MPLALLRLALAGLLAAATLAAAQTTPPGPGDDSYRPRFGQSGKDVVWIPTPDALVQRMLQAARVTDRDRVYDLGAGDGKIPIAAARDFRARAVGIEYNPELAELARRNAQRAGVADRVRIITGDIFANDFSDATVVTLYLLPELNRRLMPQLLKLKPGTRIVSHAFKMADWEPDETVGDSDRDAFLWIVPANAAGRWSLSEQRGEWTATVDVAQLYQRIGGTVTLGKETQPLLSPTLSGETLSFFYRGPDGQSLSVRGTVEGDRFVGWLRYPSYESRVFGDRVAPAPR